MYFFRAPTRGWTQSQWKLTHWLEKSCIFVRGDYTSRSSLQHPHLTWKIHLSEMPKYFHCAPYCSPSVSDSRVLLQGGAEGSNLLCQPLHHRVLQLGFVGTVETVESVWIVQRIHLHTQILTPTSDGCLPSSDTYVDRFHNHNTDRNKLDVTYLNMNFLCICIKHSLSVPFRFLEPKRGQRHAHGYDYSI